MNISIAGYNFGEQIYEGSRSRIHRGQRLSDGKRVLVKVHRNEYPTFNELAQYRNHYTITKNLDLPGVEAPLALESYGSGFALVMEDTGGISLKDFMRRSPPGVLGALEIAVELARILEELQGRRIIHKDIKPDNIIIHPGTMQVQLTDFSIATLLPRERHEAQRYDVLEGTLSYISPEQTGRMNRWIDYRSDYYSLGVTLYEILTLQLPFQSRDPMELIHGHIARRPTPPIELNPAIPQVVSDLVMKLLAKTAEARYQSAAGLRSDLEICLARYRSTGAVAPFQLGQQDVSDRFLIPDKLYGREAEVATLLRAFERVGQGAAEMMLVSGHSGIGKSALINEVHRPIVRRAGYFVAGKFDQFKRNIPFSSLVQAFRDLIRQILTERSDRVEGWRTRLLAVLGSDGEVIINVIPEVELLIGKQPPVPDLPPADHQDRFNRLFRGFIRVFARADHPLVMFLDDLQWADSASLKLLQLLMSDAETRYLLITGAYRDNEVGPAHPFAMTLERIRQAGAAVTQIALQPLDVANLNLLIAETLRYTPEQALPLTELVMSKTNGNPFFSSQYLTSLHQDGGIVFDAGSARWRCEPAIEAARSANMDVVEFMVDQLKKLPSSTQAALMLASVIGNRFDLDTLAIVSERSPSDTAADLWPALEQGAVLPLDDTYRAFQRHNPADDAIASPTRGVVSYEFLHDRVQQAAYFLIPEGERPKTHLKVGRLLLGSTSADQLDDRIFDIVNQLDTGAALIEDRAERARLVQLNLMAGLKAKASTASAAAARYLAIGMDLLPADSWTEDYRMTLALYTARAEVEYLEGSPDVSEALILEAIRHVSAPIEKAEVYLMLIVQYTLRARYPEAIEAGREALALVGVALPIDDFEAARDAEMAEIERVIGDRDIASLYDLPDMTLPDKQIAMKLLTTMGPPTYRSHQSLWSVLCSKAVNLCLKYGNAPQTAYSHTSYGGLLGYVKNDHRTGAAFGRLALRLSERFANPSDQSVAYLMVGSSLTHWSRPLKHASEDYHKAYTIGLDSGNLQYAAYAFGHNMYCRFFQGVPLEQLLTEIDGYLSFSRQRKNQWAIDLLEGGRLLIFNLTGVTAGGSDFSTPELSEERFLEECSAHRNGQVVCIYRILKSEVLYRHGRLRQAQECSGAAEEAIASVATQGLLPSARHVFIESLILTGLHAEATDEQRARRWERLLQNRQRLAIWAESCAENFLHMHQLVSAEMARISARPFEAAELYHAASESAQKSELVHDAALANELAARCWLALGREKLARSYLTDAYYGYIHWGATFKRRQLEGLFAGLLAPVLTERLASVSVEGTLSGASPSDALDVRSALQAVQVIFREIVLDKLLAKLLQITMENAGAERGFILLPKGDELRIEASSTAGLQATSISMPVRGSAELSEGIVQYVARAGEAVVLDDAALSEAYASDPHVISQKSRSLLCMPAFNHDRLVAIVYLENTLSEGCFTRERVELVRTLSTYAAIAVENALLYADVQRATEEAQQARGRLEVEVAERTGELTDANARLLERTDELRDVNARLQRELLERERAEQGRAALQEEVILAQRDRLAELSTPLIPITDEIMVMPLIGTMDAGRAAQMLETTLNRAQASHAQVVILDITGIRHMDTGVAGTLVNTAAALKLLGMQAVLTGVRSELAQTLVGLDIDLRTLVTRGTLQSGIAYAMDLIAAPRRRRRPG